MAEPWAGMEALEQRQLLAAVTWDGGGGDNNWSNPLNWLGDVVPTSTDDVTISGGDTIQVGGNVLVRSLSSQRSLSINVGSLTIQTHADLSGSADVILGNAGIAGGTWSFDEGGIVLAGTTLSIANLSTNSELVIESGRNLLARGSVAFSIARLRGTGSLNFILGSGQTASTITGDISVEGIAPGTRRLGIGYDIGQIPGTTTLAMGHTIVMSPDCGGDLVIDISGGRTFVNNGAIAIAVVGRAVSVGSGGFSGSFTNNGTFAASNGTLNMWSNAFLNPGLMSVTNQAVNVYGTFASGIGNWNRIGGTVNLQGTLNNTGQVLQLDATTGSWILEGGTINGGSIVHADGSSLVFGSTGGTLNGVILAASITYNSPSGFVLTLNNTVVPGDIVLGASSNVVISGTTSFQAARLTGNNQLRIAGGYTLNAPVIAEGSSMNNRSIIFGTLSSTTVSTIGPLGSITMAAGIGGNVSISAYGTATVINRGTISAEASGRELTIQPTTFINAGVLRLTAGTMRVAAPSGASNSGTVVVTGGTLNLQATFNASAGVGTWVRTGGVVNLVGTFNNTSNTLTLNASTGSWQLVGGTINGGSIIFSSGFGLDITSSANSALNNVAIAGELIIGTSDILTLRGTTTFTAARMTGPATLNLGAGYTLNSPVIAEGGATGTRSIRVSAGSVGTTTIGPGGSIRTAPGFGGTVTLSNASASSTLINQGLISVESAGTTLTISTTAFENHGTLRATSGVVSVTSATATSPGSLIATGNARIDFSGGVTLNTSAIVSTTAASRIELRGDLLGSTTNRDAVPGPGRVVFDGTGSALDPQDVEVMSADLGALSAGFARNFAFGTIQLVSGAYVRLIDAFDNSAGSGDEVLYVNTLIVPAGSTLDLNGFTLYARASQILGTVVGGTVSQVPDSGPLATAVPTPGAMVEAGEMDEWTFHAFAGRAVTIVVNPSTSGFDSALPPPIGRVQVEVLGPSGVIIASGSSATVNQVITLAGLTTPVTGTYRVRVQAVASSPSDTGSYTITRWDSTPDLASVSFNQSVVGAIETPFGVDRWTFAAAAGQQIRFDLMASNSSDLRFTLTGPDGYIGFSAIAGDSALLTLPSTGQYVLAASALGSSTGQYGFSLVQTEVIALPLDSPTTRVHAGSGSARLFKIDLSSSTPLLVRLDDSNNSNRNEMYIRFGQAPTQSEYDLRYTLASSADQSLIINNAQPGEWYVLVFGRSVPTASTITIEAVAAPVVVLDAAPSRSRAAGSAIINISGAGFRPGMQVELVNAEGTVTAAATDVEINGFASASVTMPLGGVPVGQYSIRVTLPGLGGSELPNGFRVTAAGTPRFEANLIVPGQLGRQAIATLYVEYANTGTEAMPAPLLQVRSGDADGSDKPILTLDQSRLAQGFWTHIVADGFGHSVQFLASGAAPGLLLPGERITIPVYYVGLLGPWDMTDTVIEMSLGILESNNTELIPWSELSDGLRPPTVATDAWAAIYQNLQANVGATWGQYVQMLSENAQYLGRLGQRVIDADELWAFERYQAAGINIVGDLASVTDASFDTPGGGLWFGRTYSGELAQRYQSSIFGRGWSAPWMTRLIQENDGSATIASSSGTVRRFEPDARFPNRLNGVGGDPSRLVRKGGEYLLTDVSGARTRFASDGRVLWAEDANSNRFTMQYSGGQLVGIASANNGSITLTYNAAGLVQTVTDPAGRTATYEYDASNQYLVAVTAWNGRVTTYAYDNTPGSPSQHALRRITELGTTRHFEYDFRGRLAATYRDSGIERTDFTYNSTGRVTVADATGASRSVFVDHLARPARQVDEFGQVWRSEFGADDRVSRIIDPLGQAQSFTWCGCGGLASSTDAAGNTARFTYAKVGPNGTINRMVSSTDQNGNVTRYTYDSRGNLLATIGADGPSTTFTSYDAAGNALGFVNRRGQGLSAQYDSAGRITRQTYADSTFETWTYDSFGRLVSSTDRANQTTTYTLNALGEVSRIDYPAGRFLEFTYNAAGRRASMTDQTGFVVNYAYNAAGRLESITDGSGTTLVSYLYDSVGRVTLETNANGTSTEFGYDAAGRTTSVINRGLGGTVNSQFSYTFDVLGQLTSTVSLDGVWSYQHDAAGQLIGAQFVPAPGSSVPAQSLAYVYDAAGNRVQTIENGVVTDYTTNALNQYTQIGDDTLMYDADGNLVSRSGPLGTVTYQYDQLNRMVGVSSAEGVWEYSYDAMGNRVSATTNGDRIEYMIDPAGLDNVVGEYDAGGALLARNIIGLGLVARHDAQLSQWSFFDGDILGSVVGVTNGAGAIANTYAYSAFGEMLASVETIANAYEYVGVSGVETLGNGLLYMRARHYSESQGRFTSLDPIGLAGGDMNLYRYTENAPLLRIDPIGLGWTDDWAFEIGAEAYLLIGGGGSVAFNLDGTVCASIEIGTGFGVGVGVGVTPSKESGDTVIVTIGGNIGPLAGSVGSEAQAYGPLQDQLEGQIGITGKGVGSIGIGAKLARSKTWCRKNPMVTGGASIIEFVDQNVLFGVLGREYANAFGSLDPNVLHGPEGFGPANFVGPTQLLPYLIEFENYGPGSENEDGTPVSPDRWASAPAQRVVITNDLSPNFDLSSFRYTRFGFGDIDILLPEPSQSWEQVLQITIDDVTFELWFSADIDYETRRLRMSFQSIDPVTSLPPDVLTGFLPPEDGTGRGLGFVGYTIAPIAGLPTGTEIRNIALIQFDGQLLIPTNQIDPLDPSQGTDPDKEALVTIDSGRPQSQMDALQSVINSSSFMLRWSGQDDAGGSGIVAYRVYVSTDGGEYVLWTETSETELEFTAQWGRTYSFYSVGIDGVGNEEEAPLTPDASTRTPRLIMWDGGVDGMGTDLSDPVNWVGDMLPTADDNVLIDDAGGLQLTFAGELTFRSLLLAGHLTITSGTLTVLEHVQIDGELVVLGSLVSGLDVRSSGSIWLGSMGLLQVGRDLALSESTVVGVAVRSVGEFGRLMIAGAANLDGLLAVSFVDGYMPAIGHTVRIVTATSVTGEFTETSVPQLPGNFKSPLLTDVDGVRILFTSIADFNNSGTVDVADIFAFLSAWFAGGADFNGNGTSDVADIFSYLSAWFADR